MRARAYLKGQERFVAQLIQYAGSRQMQSRACSTRAASGDQVALVAGASRGLGLEYVKQLLERPGQRVIAACRSPNNAQALNQLCEKHMDRLEIVEMDITKEDSIQAAYRSVSERHEYLDKLINAAGILHTDTMAPETALSRLEAKNMLTNFQINAMGPILVSKAFAPLLAKASKVKDRSESGPAVVASMSARVGSIRDNEIGGWHSYRASKSALNQLNKCMSIEFARKKQNITCILLHPGTVDTDLSKPFQKNVKPEKLFSKERAIKQLLDIIDNAKMADNGRFIAWDGQTIPW